jgi:hypothetical protein
MGNDYKKEWEWSRNKSARAVIGRGSNSLCVINMLICNKRVLEWNGGAGM